MGSDMSVLKEEANCSICLEMMKEPVSIDCGHSYCRSCITDICEKKQPEAVLSLCPDTFYCPQCRRPFQKESIRPNTQLHSIIEAARDMEKKWVCKEHGENLRLFCEDEGQLICWLCERSPRHKGHNTALVEDMHQGYEIKIRDVVNKMKDMDDQCKNQNVLTKNQITEWKEKVRQQKQKIQADFQNFHSFLYEEEKSYLSRLKEEKEKTLKKLQENETNVENQRRELKKHIQELEKKCQRSKHYLLQDVQDTLARSSAVKVELPEAVSLEIQTECDISKLRFDETV